MLTAAILSAAQRLQLLQAPEPSWHERCGYCCFGMNVAAAGDFDKDGTPDMIVGDPGYSSEEGIGPTFFVLSVRDGSVLQRISLPVEDRLSLEVDGGHDVDGDGVPDILIGAGNPAPGAHQAVELFSGASGNVLHSWSAELTWRDYGTWMSFVSDVDGDGASDVGILSRQGSSRCSLAVYSSRSGLPLLDHPIQAECGEQSIGFTEIEDGPRGRLGYALLLSGTSTRNSSVQLFPTGGQLKAWRSNGPNLGWHGRVTSLRAYGNSYTLAASYFNEVDVLDARTGDVLHRFVPDFKTEDDLGFGWDVASIGDIDGDGTADLAFSETESGLSEGTVYARSGQSGRTLWSVTDLSADDTYRLGYQLAALGDVDGDGICDLAAGTWGSKGGAPGRAFVISGKTGAIIREFRRNDDGVYVKRSVSVTSPR